jgi:hypothetical protein
MEIFVSCKAGLRYDIWWGKSARTKYSSGVTKPVTAENSGHSYSYIQSADCIVKNFKPRTKSLEGKVLP